MLRKVGLLLAACLLSAIPLLADGTSTTTFTFLGDGLGDIGNNRTFTAGTLSLIVSGYNGPLTLTDLFAKSDVPNGGSPEVGLGLANGLDHEISGTEFVQLNIGRILAASPLGVSLSLTSLQGSEAYDVWGSNVQGEEGTLLASNQRGTSFNIGDRNFQFISVSAANLTDSVLLDDVDVTVPTPEPSTLVFLGLGLIGLLIWGRRLAYR